MSVPKPYHIHRQWHLGDFLDELQKLGHITWKWSYRNSRAEYTITEPGKAPLMRDTKSAEAVALRIAKREEIVWIPVPHWGGEDRWEETRATMASMIMGDQPKPWETA